MYSPWFLFPVFYDVLTSFRRDCTPQATWFPLQTHRWEPTRTVSWVSPTPAQRGPALTAQVQVQDSGRPLRPRAAHVTHNSRSSAASNLPAVLYPALPAEDSEIWAVLSPRSFCSWPSVLPQEALRGVVSPPLGNQD